MKITRKNVIFLLIQTLASSLILASITPNVFADEASTTTQTCVFFDVLSQDNPNSCLIDLKLDENHKTKKLNFLSSIATIEKTPKKSNGQKSEQQVKKSFQTLAFSPQYTSTLSAEVLFNLINEYRSKYKLSPFERDDTVCKLATERAGELYQELFVSGRLHSGFYNRNLPYIAAENVIYARSENLAFNWWLNSSVHRASILSDYKYSCLACSSNACTQIFTSFVPKQQLLTANN